MSTHSVRIHWNGMEIEAEVYRGSTPSGGPDPSCIENMEIVSVTNIAALNEYLVDQLYETEAVMEKLWEEADSDDD